MIKKEAKTIADLGKELSCNDPIDIRSGDVLLEQSDYEEITKCFNIVRLLKRTVLL